MDYKEFIKSKQKTTRKTGFKPDTLTDGLKDFQQFIVNRALDAGKYAIFADCGLGKTFMQLEWAYRVSQHAGGRVLVLAPLAVSGQTINEAVKFNLYCDRVGQDSIVQITNYEDLENVNADDYVGVVLDESSILKNFTGKTKQAIIDTFKDTPYKLACTATPSPNDPMELGNHAEFLDVMTRNEMLAMYFVHDGGETAKWRLKGHAKKEFYKWVSTWAIMISKPSDIGFSDEGYDLPDLNLIPNVIETEKRDNGMLFNDEAVSATNFNKELRITKFERIEQAVKLLQDSPNDESIICWIKQNEEGQLIRELVPDVTEVRGDMKKDRKEELLLGFANGDYRVLVTKAKIAQYGLNYQNCNKQIFASIDFSFEGLYQAIRRSYRFGQTKPVHIYIITTDTMGNVIESINRKQHQFEEMQKEMRAAILSNINEKESIETQEIEGQYKTDLFDIRCGDCVELIKSVPDESVGLSVFSPPFAELYTYSNIDADMGNCSDYNVFLQQFGYLVRELYRVVKSGRNVAVHCMDLPIQKGKEGYIGLRDFSGMILQAFSDAGFIYHSRITIWKNPVVEMQRTKALGLLHKQVKKDSTMSRVGIPDYVMVFRKDGERNDPVQNTDINVDLWQKIASPVWSDIDYGNTLQGVRDCREENDEKHICPLQLETIERLIMLYSNKGDTIYTPFMGIGSEVYQAIKMGRKGIGHELKPSYFEQAKKNIEMAINDLKQTALF